MAPSNNRCAKWRANLKDRKDDYETYLKKDRERKKKARAELKLKRQGDPLIDASERERKREEMRRYRQKSKTTPLKSPDANLGSYSCANTLRKAVVKSLKVLPQSPSKKRAVVRQLIKETFNKNSDISLTSPSAFKKRISQATEIKVIKFYHSDGISWQAPGKRDFVSMKDGAGKKVHAQKRYMLMTVNEAHAIFKKKHGDIIGKSKFFALRPKNVLQVRETPHNVCVCIIHANFIFLVNSLEGVFLDKHDHTSLINVLCCDTKAEKCMTNKCRICQYDVQYLLKLDLDMLQKVKYKQWGKDQGHLKVLEKEVTLQFLIQEINKMIPTFKTHSYIKKIQSDYFDERKKNLNENDAVIQVDFAENYSLIAQDEIQSAHWQHSQTTLFTCCIWMSKATRSYVVVSDDLTHSKESAWVFLKAIIADVQKYKKLNNLYIFSDNCSAQFRSKFTLHNMLYLKDDLNVKYVEWSTFAPGHGKGSVDGIGGTVKRAVWLAVKARNKAVSTPIEFYECAINVVKKIKVLFIEKKDIEETCENLLAERWKNVCPIIGIRGIHYFKKTGDQLSIAITSKSQLSKVPLKKVSFSDINRERIPFRDVYSDSEESTFSINDELDHQSEEDIQRNLQLALDNEQLIEPCDLKQG